VGAGHSVAVCRDRAPLCQRALLTEPPFAYLELPLSRTPFRLPQITEPPFAYTPFRLSFIPLSSTYLDKHKRTQIWFTALKTSIADFNSRRPHPRRPGMANALAVESLGTSYVVPSFRPVSEPCSPHEGASHIDTPRYALKACSRRRAAYQHVRSHATPVEWRRSTPMRLQSSDFGHLSRIMRPQPSDFGQHYQ